MATVKDGNVTMLYTKDLFASGCQFKTNEDRYTATHESRENESKTRAAYYQQISTEEFC